MRWLCASKRRSSRPCLRGSGLSDTVSFILHAPMHFFGMLSRFLHVCKHTYTHACTNACMYEHARMHTCMHVRTGVNFQAHANADVFFHVQELRQCLVISKKQVIPRFSQTTSTPFHVSQRCTVYDVTHAYLSPYKNEIY